MSVSVATAGVIIGPIALHQARRASWFADLNSALELGNIVNSFELVTALDAAQAELSRGFGAPCTAPQNDQERANRRVARVRSAVIDSLRDELVVATDRSGEKVPA